MKEDIVSENPASAAHPPIKQLADRQLESFDVEYVRGARWELIRAHLDRDFPTGEFRFLDVGGGNGLFADLLLRHYPLARGVVLDNSELLLNKNQPSERKERVLASAAEIPERLQGQQFDLVCFNWVLHHLVAGRYAHSLANIQQALRHAKALLGPQGRLSVFENLYDGRRFDRLPSRLIFELTASRLLAPLTGALGANTAGCGVCFLSRSHWDEQLAQAGFTVVACDHHEQRRVAPATRLLLQLGEVSVGHYWCR